MEFYGAVGSAKALITSYIKDSYQQVLINSTSSLWGNGVPQCFILNDNPYVYIKLMYQYTVECIVTNSVSDRSVRTFNRFME